VRINHAAVTWGAGIEPAGKRPLGHYEAQVILEGRKVPTRPAFRVWRVQADQLRNLQGKATKIPSVAGAVRLETKVTMTARGSWTLTGFWQGALDTSDRLVIEVRSGSRLLGWASAQPIEQLIQTINKKRTLTPMD
jgi:hypothetical protein